MQTSNLGVLTSTGRGRKVIVRHGNTIAGLLCRVGVGGVTMQKQQKENQFVSPTSHDSHNHRGDQTALQRLTHSGAVDQLLAGRPCRWLEMSVCPSGRCEITAANTWISLDYKEPGTWKRSGWALPVWTKQQLTSCCKSLMILVFFSISTLRNLI